MSKSNQMESNRRILAVSKMLLSGKSNKVIFRYTSLSWGITSRQTQNYIKASFSLWYKEFKVKHKANLSYHLAKRADLYFQAYKQKDWQTCLSIAKDEAKIMDVYPSIKTDLKIEEEGDQEVIEKKVKERLLNLLEFLSKEQLKVFIAIVEGKKEIEVSEFELIQDLRYGKGVGPWKEVVRKKPAILALEDLQYIDDKRKKKEKGVKKTNV